MQPFQPFYQKAWPYNVVDKVKALAVELPLLKDHLKLTSCSQDAILKLYIESAIEQCEQITGLTLLTKTFETYRDHFPIDYREAIELQRSPVQSVESIEYFSAESESWVTVTASDYFVTNRKEGLFGNIFISDGKSWPSVALGKVEEGVKITFKAGYGDSSNKVPAGLRVAIMEHATFFYFNRGDCSEESLPEFIKDVYRRYRIVRL